jgi:hypothetical protein
MTSPDAAADLLAAAEFAEEGCPDCGEVDRCAAGCEVTWPLLDDCAALP